MAGQKEELAKAIISGNWEMVRSYYNFIYDEVAPRSPISEQKIDDSHLSNIVNSIFDIIKPYLKEDVNDILISQASEDIDVTTTSSIVNSGVTFVTGESSEDTIPGYKEAVRKIGSKIKKTTRPPYSPKMVNCELCGASFDFKKEYPAGVLDKNARLGYRCNKCKNKKK